jgi:hypothetical protein
VNHQLHRLEAAAGPHARRLRLGSTVTLQQLDTALRLQSLSAATALACRVRGGSAACSRLVTALAAGLAEACCCDTATPAATADSITADSTTVTADSGADTTASTSNSSSCGASVRLLRVCAEGLVALLTASAGASHPLLTAHTLHTLLLQPVQALLAGQTVHGEASAAVAAAARAVLRSRHAHLLLLLQQQQGVGSVAQQPLPPPPPLHTAAVAAAVASSSVQQQQWQPPPALALLLQCAVALSQQLGVSGATANVQQLQLALSYTELVCELPQVRNSLI